MFIPIKWYSKYLRNDTIMSNFSRDMTIVTLCRQSFILQMQCVLYFWVCSIFKPALCAVNINESIVSIISSGSRHGKLTIYDSATGATDGTCTKISRGITCRHVFDMTGIFYWYVNIKKKRSWRQPYLREEQTILHFLATRVPKITFSSQNWYVFICKDSVRKESLLAVCAIFGMRANTVEDCWPINKWHMTTH